MAGLLTGACTNPIWVVKTRMLERGANHPEAYKSMWFGLKHVYATRGLKGLWAGFLPSTLGVAHGAVQFAIYEKMKHRRGGQIGGQQHLSNWDYIYMSGGSKLLAGAITCRCTSSATRPFAVSPCLATSNTWRLDILTLCKIPISPSEHVFNNTMLQTSTQGSLMLCERHTRTRGSWHSTKGTTNQSNDQPRNNR